MKILLEGPDKTGKSTLARALSELYKTDYFHFSYEKDNDTFNAQVRNVNNLLNSEDKNIIIDRFLLSEHIYGKICRGNDRSEIGDYDTGIELKESLFKFDMIIFCLPHNYDKYMASFDNFNSDADKFEYKAAIGKEKEIFQAYQDFYMTLLSVESIKDKVYRYDYFKVI